ncbi:MAG: CRTAC1 family protein [Pirellulaceae bacterium]|nr:CRTAC1 family protein [Pirellulaceae bacterium]
MAMGRSSRLLWLSLAVAWIGSSGCGPTPAANSPVPGSAGTAPPVASPFDVDIPQTSSSELPQLSVDDCPQLRDVHQAAGIDFVYLNGQSDQALMVESIGGGAGWLDYDGDGRLDLLLCQGGDPTATDLASAPVDQLYRNQGQGTFAPVTSPARLVEPQYSQGVAIGDFDNDGFDDIYVTNVGRNSLFQNQGDGTFVELSATAGVDDPRWSSSAAWADLDQDGDLDLYVANYCDYDPRQPIECRDRQGKLRICHPRDVPPAADECYVNQGDGTFLASAQRLGLYGPGNRALGVAVADFTGDGLPDIYVANDTTENFLFVNEGGGQSFRESATLLGCAVDHRGHRQASMGLAVGDFDDNGFLDIYSTHYYEESNTLYRNLGPRGFEDVTGIMGLHNPTYALLGFGTVLADLNQDGHDELFVTNGHIDPLEKVYAMRPQLFTLRGDQWAECGSLSGPIFEQPLVGRGVAAGDYDDDGDLDLAVVHQNQPAALLRNESRRGHWLKLRLIGTTSNRRCVGAHVTVRGQDRQRVQQLCGGTSFASSHEPALIFGLGANADPVSLTVTWPSGRAQTLDNVAVDQAVLLVEP